MRIKPFFILLICTLVGAKIVEYGLWTNNDFTDHTHNVNVINGIASGQGAGRGVQILDATMEHPDISTYLTQENV